MTMQNSSKEYNVGLEMKNSHNTLYMFSKLSMYCTLEQNRLTVVIVFVLKTLQIKKD